MRVIGISYNFCSQPFFIQLKSVKFILSSQIRYLSFDSAQATFRCWTKLWNKRSGKNCCLRYIFLILAKYQYTLLLHQESICTSRSLQSLTIFSLHHRAERDRLGNLFGKAITWRKGNNIVNNRVFQINYKPGMSKV